MSDPSRAVRWAFVALVWLGAGLAAWALHQGPSPSPSPSVRRPVAPRVVAMPEPAASDAGADAGVAPQDEPAASGATPRVRGPRRGRLAWRFRTGGRITGPVATDAAGVYVASHDGRLYALDRAGQLRWQVELGAPSYSGVVADASTGRLYVGTEDGRLQGFSARGRRVLSVAFDAPVDRPVVPLPGGGVLLVAGRRLLAVSAEGRVRHRFEAYRKIFTRPALSPLGPHVGAQDHRLYALDWRLSPRWQRDLGADVDGAPAALGGLVVAATDAGRVHAFDAAGVPRWTADVGGAVRAPVVATADGRVLVQVNGVAPALVCLDRGDGRERFRHRFSLEDSPTAGSRAAPLVDGDGVVYAGGYDDSVVALDREGRVLFVHRTGGHVHADLVLDTDGTLYAGADDGVLYALRD